MSSAPSHLLGKFQGSPAEQLAFVVDTMREMSLQTDPQKMVKQYGNRVRRLMNTDRFISMSRRNLASRYTGGNGTFVTAFYGIYDCKHRTLTYASAGHCPPRIRRAGNGILESMDRSRQLPLGIEPNETYVDIVEPLQSGDNILIYTDGITEARNPRGDFYGLELLDKTLMHNTCKTTKQLLDAALQSLEAFTNGTSATDDRTLLAISVRRGM
jgi:sigma-B regulation protein RsbU (phosphoserine phosphatase)